MVLVKRQQPFRSSTLFFCCPQWETEALLAPLLPSDWFQKLKEFHTETLSAPRQIWVPCSSHQIFNSTEISAWHSQTAVMASLAYLPWKCWIKSQGLSLQVGFSEIYVRMLLIVTPTLDWLASLTHKAVDCKVAQRHGPASTFLLSSRMLWNELYLPMTSLSLGSWSSVGQLSCLLVA